MATLTPTKTLRTVQASASNAAAGTTTATGVDLTTKFGGTLTAKITNGGTGPSAGCTCTVEVSGDNSAWKTFAAVTHVTTASAVGQWAFAIPDSVMYVRTVFSGNTSQAVTVEAFLQELTSISSA